MDNEHKVNDLIHHSLNDNIQKKKTKKKSRRNRTLQRHRRKLRKQDLNSDTIVELIHSSLHISQPTINTIEQEEIEQGNDPMFNENISDVPNMIEKKKKKNKNKKQKKTNSNNRVPKKKDKVSPVIKDTYDYSSVSDEIFSQMLSIALNGTEHHLDFMNQNEKIKFIRRYTSLIDRLSYVKLQQSQWKFYKHIGMKDNIWYGHIAKHIAEKYSIQPTYGRSKLVIEHRLKHIKQQLVRTQNTIKQFEEEISSKFAQENDCSTTMKKLSLIISRFVEEKQKLLQCQLSYKQNMLLHDAKDHQLLQKFYDVEPNKTHHIIARRIWDATKQIMSIQEDIILLKYRLISTQAYSTSNLVHHMINNIHKRLNNSNEIVQTFSGGDALGSDDIHRLQLLKTDIIQQAINTNHELVDNFNRIIQVEQNKFSVKNRYMESTSEWQQMVFDTIEQRRLQMIARGSRILCYNLMLLFDICNTTSSNHKDDLSVILHESDNDDFSVILHELENDLFRSYYKH